jgi:hypothetical protein
MTETRVCRKCKIEKPISEFGKHATGPGGLRSACKPCNMAYAYDWIKKNPERRKANCRAYYARHGKESGATRR